jgi:predicted ribosomally synthesized peptide with SipW-like signal peptide
MNKKILASIFIIGMLAFGLGWGTYSYFSDTETSTGNVFTAGTINIDVTGNGYTWSGGAKLLDMKPCQTGYITFNITNVGTNPVNVWKHIKNVVCSGGNHPESEEAEDPSDTKNWLPPWILYDLSVKVYDANNKLIWWQVIIPEDAVTVEDIRCHDIPLGMIPVGDHMMVTQSYHMKAETGNWAQGDQMTFDIEIYAEQLNGELMPGLLLVPKEQAGPTGETGEWIIDWNTVVGGGTSENWQGTYGFLTYNTKGSTFDYTFKAYKLTPTTQYSLIYYADPWPGDGNTHATGALIAKFTTDGSGNIGPVTGSVELGTDLPNAGDANFPGGAKIWLVPSTHYSTTTPGQQGHMTAWSYSEYLFEFSLIKYDDIDVP